MGIFPQCGFSVVATNLYAARIITLGTLISVYLSTSDEMLPILISKAAPMSVIITILAIKFVIGMIYGFVIDIIINIKNKNKKEENKIIDLCEEEHCHCEKGIVKSALKHTINVFIYIFILTLLINIIVEVVGEDTLKNIMQGASIFEPIIASLIGLIPNCASINKNVKENIKIIILLFLLGAVTGIVMNLFAITV